uniref:Uncharacterized protein n=1 Tax=Eutreptiella gymnastica TaxID=73025 RepID=A0A7S1HSJ6_9EUGL
MLANLSEDPETLKMYCAVFEALRLNTIPIPLFVLLGVWGCSPLTVALHLIVLASSLSHFLVSISATPSMVVLPAGIGGAACLVSISFSRHSMNHQQRYWHLQRQVSGQAKASMAADSVLHHVLKNILLEADSLIKMHIKRTEKCACSSEALQNAMVLLERGVLECSKRQTYLRICNGTYTVTPRRIVLRELVGKLTAAREVQSDIQDMDIQADTALAELILDNVINNALKHGRADERGPVVHLCVK